MQYYLPKGTQSAINKSQQCSNLRLLLDKYPPQDVVNKNEALDSKKDTKGSWLRDIVSFHKGNDALARAAYHRWYSYTSALQATHFSEAIDWRMVVGLGSNSILETDVTLQHLYGTPVIPGSALKGLARSYAATEDKEVYIKKGDKFVPSEELDSDHPDIQRIFGTQKQAGSVIFFDAFPKGGEAHFELDIMNPHYPKYYQGEEPPTNSQNPIPIPFLTIARTPFMFALALRQSDEKGQEQDLQRALSWLKEALERHGVGGKTSAGYGYFRGFESQSPLPESAYTAQEGVPLPLKRYQGPPIPQFHEGKELQNCQVILPTERMLQLFPTASAYLRYQEFPTHAVFIAIEESLVEARDWKPPESRGCVVSHVEEHEDCLILVCKPRQKKNKKSKEKK